VIGGATRVYALLGRPVGHSLSPALHNALFAHLGVDAVYVALDVAPAQAAAVPAALRALGLAGANLTVPLKEAVLDGLDALSPGAARAGAVNTVLRGEDGALIGHTTDGEGLLAAIAEAGGARGPAAVLGAGGAGRAVAAALSAAGVRTTLLNRDPARARRAGEALGLPWGGLEALPELAPGLQLVVDCTRPEGHTADVRTGLHQMPPGALWVDTRYFLELGPLRAACAARGLRLMDGRPMLLHQALAASALWTGLRVPADRARALAPAFGPPGGGAA
jgi:shikimate dehydrogenase